MRHYSFVAETMDEDRAPGYGICTAPCLVGTGGGVTATAQRFERLGRTASQRAIGTGRRLYSWGLLAAERLPVDYVVFSSRAGNYDVAPAPACPVALAHCGETEEAVRVLHGLDLDFVVHRAIPVNHHSEYRRAGRPNTDFAGLDRCADLR